MIAIRRPFFVLIRRLLKRAVRLGRRLGKCAIRTVDEPDTTDLSPREHQPHQSAQSKKATWSLRAAVVHCLLFLAAAAAPAADTLWRNVTIGSKTFDVHVVSNVSLGNGFPSRDLRYALDAGLVSDIYVVDQSTGQATSLNEARNVVALLQTSFKYPADPSHMLGPNEAIDPVDLANITSGYPLWTSSYFSNIFVNTVLTGGAVGLDNQSHRTQIYEEIFFDMALQPELADRPGDVQRYQTLLDRTLDVDEVISALGSEVSAYQLGNSIGTIPWGNYTAALGEIKLRVRRLVDLDTAAGPPPPLERLEDELAVLNFVQAVSGAAARGMLLEALALEVGALRMRVLDDYVDRLVAAGGVDPALVQGFNEAQSRVQELTSEYFDNLPTFIASALAEDPFGTLHLDKLSKYVVQKWLGKKAATTFARVATPWVLSYKTYRGIRRQQDRAQTASIAATLHKELFDAQGLPHLRSQMHSGGGVDALDAQAFAELYQMSWFLSARHYQDTLETLNNKLSRVYGLGLNLFTGGAYSSQMDLLRGSLNYRRMAAQRIGPPSYLATVSDFRVSAPQDGEFTWLMQKVRDDIVTVPYVAPSRLLDVCITLPFDPAGTPATLEGMNIRYEPRSCSDPANTQAWECGPNDPDGKCRARVQLFWDDDQDPGNANCQVGSGPCPINGAEDLNPTRPVFFWQPERDGLTQEDFYIFARISDEEDSSESYSAGFYQFIDPIREGDHWSVALVEVTEGGRSDSDGIPEIGEEIDIELVIENESGRNLNGVKLDDLAIEGDPARHQTIEDFDETIPSNQTMTFIYDDTVLAPNASVGQQVATTDDFNVWIGSDSETSIDFVVSISYNDPGNPSQPGLRRLQEVDFSVDVSDGTTGPQFRCDSTRIVDDTDGDGVFESGEIGRFKANLCNDGTWLAHSVRGTFQGSPAFGRWVDEDSPYPDLSPGECQEGTDDFSLRMEPDECGNLALPLQVEFNGNQVQSGLSCSVSVSCAPYQSIQDEKDAGVVSPGDTLSTSVSIFNSGAAPLLISNVVEKNGASDTTVTGFPSSLAAGASGTIDVEIDSSSLPAGSDQRTILVTSNANNTDERESLIFFGVGGGGAAQQLTFSGVHFDRADIDGDLAVFSRGNDIYMLNVRTLVETAVTTTPAEERLPRISGNRIVFNRRDPASGTFDVFLYEISSGTETQLTDLPVSQNDADIRGDFVVWEDRRAGVENADIYSYQIPGGAVNGTLLADLGTNFSAQDPRVEDDYVAFRRRNYLPNNFVRSDFAYKDRSTGTLYTLGLNVANLPCSAGNLFDVFDNHLAFECDCGAACDNDDQLYYVNMDTHSSPVRMTCDPGFTNDREEPSLAGTEVLYKRDGVDDIYKVAVGAGCQTEVPLHVGASLTTVPAADPRSGSYVFNDNQTGALELWGVVPPPPVEAGVSGFDLDQATYFQNGSYGLHVEVTNYGTQDLPAVDIIVTDSGVLVFSGSVANLLSGTSQTLDGTWSTAGSAVGPRSLMASLNPAPAGDGNPSNDFRVLTPNVVDDDESPPVVSGITVLPASTSDGDQYIEDGEAIQVLWRATDPSGIAATSVSLLSTDYPGTEGTPGDYAATLPNPGIGAQNVEVAATDADDSMETSSPTSVMFTVYPAFPQVVNTVPANSSTGVDPRATLSVSFSVEMDVSSIDGQSIVLEGPGSTGVPTTLTYDPGTMSVLAQPLLALDPNTSYVMTSKGGAGGVRDIRQNPLPVDVSWSFETGDIVGGCGFPDAVVVANTTLTGNQVREACLKITIGPNVTIQPGTTLTIRAPEVEFAPNVSIEAGAIVSVESVTP